MGDEVSEKSLPSALIECLRRSGVLVLLVVNQSQLEWVEVELSFWSNNEYDELNFVGGKVLLGDGVSGVGGLIGEPFCCCNEFKLIIKELFFSSSIGLIKLAGGSLSKCYIIQVLILFYTHS